MSAALRGCVEETTTAGELGSPIGEALPDSVDGARAVIDDIDDELVRLLERRRVVSGHIQALRTSRGEGKVAMSREYEVMARYRAVLGRPGARVAVSVLELCRGTG